ncbi:MAG TPA: TolC family protein [Bryobacteraceae bacterium]|jgi:outer membrane protein|nr:TolC family protein [Bryobacteraceae bacterium]
MRKFQAIVTIVTLWACSPARGQTPAPAQPAVPAASLSLPQATALALKSHPQISAAQDTEASAGQKIIESRAPYYPTLDGEITAAQGLFDSRLGAGSLSSSQLFNRFGQGLQITQLVSDFGRTKNLVAQSQFQSQAAAQNTQATVYNVVLGVNRGYFGVLQAQAFVTVANETIKARQTLSDQVTALANAQLKSQLDVSFADVNLSEAKLLLIRSQDAVERAYADLARSMGQENVVRYRLDTVPPPGAPPASAEPLITEAIQNRPELRNLQLQVQGAESFERAEADLTHPSVSFIAVGGGLPYLNQDPRVAPHGYEGAAVNVDIPIFNGHLFSARKQAARYEADAASQRYRNLRQQVELDVRGAWISASTAYQRIPVTQQLLNQAQLALQLAQGRYNLGLASIVEITQAQLNLTQAQIENVSAVYDYQIAYAQLQYTVGSLR